MDAQVMLLSSCMFCVCMCVRAREKVAGTLCAVFNLFACTSTNMGQYSPK